MPKYALITGSTSGIGKAFTEQLAREGFHLVLVARNDEALNSQARDLTNRFHCHVETIVADLSDKEQRRAISNRICSTENRIEMLVNNAGFGQKGTFWQIDVEDHLTMMEVNAVAVLDLTHSAIKTMSEHGGGSVVNVASIAAFTPGIRPSSTYAATKAFVVALTEGLFKQSRDAGVNLIAVCPGWVKTDFHRRANMEMRKLPGLFWLTPEEVVTQALTDLRSGNKPISIASWVYKIIYIATRILPRSLYNRIGKLFSNRVNT